MATPPADHLHGAGETGEILGQWLSVEIQARAGCGQMGRFSWLASNGRAFTLPDVWPLARSRSTRTDSDSLCFVNAMHVTASVFINDDEAVCTTTTMLGWRNSPRTNPLPSMGTTAPARTTPMPISNAKLLRRPWDGRHFLVAQISNLLYRRFPIGRASGHLLACQSLRTLRRLETCDTADWKSALQAGAGSVAHPAVQAEWGARSSWRSPRASWTWVSWEQIFYGEFDGRRRKRVLVKIIGE